LFLHVRLVENLKFVSSDTIIPFQSPDGESLT